MDTSAPAHAAQGAGGWFALLPALRAHQWTKNLLVFAALLFARKFHGPGAEVFILLSAAGFAVFCAASSAAYLLNDVLDAAADRRHPLKRLRPVASGALAPSRALGAAALLAAAALAAGFTLGLRFGAVVVAYLVLQVAYSLVLKHVVILDVLCIAASFVLRADAGALVIGVAFSHWLLICAAFLALFLALAKRRHELAEVADATNHRRSLADYTPQMLDQMIAAVTASTLMAYALYTIDRDTVAKFGTDNLVFTIPFVLYGVFRYLYLVYAQRGGGSPSRHLLTDKPLLVCVFLYAVACAWIVWRWGAEGAP